ncbi:hypothetical protein JXO59_13495 [candidate division KSB1 bacterium]|nr:hypothetical protein [candidate division KSB1 bacterium]
MRTVLYILLLCLFVVLTASADDEFEKTIFEKSFDVHGELVLHLDVDAADIKLNQNNRDECKVFIEYNKENCDLTVNYDNKDHELDISVDHDNIDIVKEKEEKKSKYAIIRIDLPNRSEIDIDATIRAGQMELQLGDLKIRNLELNSWAGEGLIDFDRPNRMEINRLDIDFKIGKIEICHLGNARFKEADINSAIGELTVDFSGQAVDRAMARIDLEIGKTTLIVPEKIGVKMKVSKFLFLSEVDYPRWFEKRGSYYYSRNYDEEDASLYLSISTGIGEVNIKTTK